MRDVKGRHDLITRGWIKLVTHVRSNMSVFMTIKVFFSGKYGFNVLTLSLQSASSRTTMTLSMTLASNTTNHKLSSDPARQVLCLML